MRMVDIITKKRDGYALNREEIAFFVSGFALRKYPEDQAAALLMAICLNGMGDQEVVDMAQEMAALGERVDFSGVRGKVADKHSTGGVGDNTSLVALPLAASVGVRVAKMAGRGLGYTGGTLEKLEAIPGYKTGLTPSQFVKVVNDVGISIIAKTGRLAGAAARLYELQDATATAESQEMISASVISRAFLSGTDYVMLDVKLGSGSFFKTIDEGKALAQGITRLMVALGMKTTVLLSNMEVPLGRAVGNTLEVLEAVNTLRGKGPKDLTLLSIEIAANMLAMTSGQELAQCRDKCRSALESGAGFAKFLEMVEAHGGDVSCLTHPERLKRAKVMHEVKAPATGYIQKMDSKKIGLVAAQLGACREQRESRSDHSAGIVLLKKNGEKVVAGEPMARFYTERETAILVAEKEYLSAVAIGEEAPEKQLLVYGRVDSHTISQK